jgi:hypothetical protein
MAEDAEDGGRESSAADGPSSEERSADTDGPASGDGAAPGDRDAPLGDLAERRRARREARESADADADDAFSALGREATTGDHDQASVGDAAAVSDDAFEEMDVEPVDSEDVWADLLDEETDETETPLAGAAAVDAANHDTAVEGATSGVSTETTAAGVDADEAGPAVDPRPEHVIPKADYCQKCAYFSDPPEVACGHEGTDIVSVDDFDHFRVRGCPVVENEFDPEDR